MTTICFINRAKPGAEIYATFAKRLVDSALKYTNFDIRIATNEPELFEETLTLSPRISLLVNRLEKNRVAVGPFNQLLKFFALKDIPETYDYVLYLDCDAGFVDTIDESLLKQEISAFEHAGYNGMVFRSSTEYLMQALHNHEDIHKKDREMFSAKFIFYDVTTENIPEEWKDATLPCEHILFLKNESGKIQAMSDKISEFNDKLESQHDYVACASDMEAFELGISAKLAGFKFAELGTYIHNEVLKVKFNGSNWERVKL
jgi:hypothetical protein